MKVSVIIPVYNAGKFLARAIESALFQAHVEEVILVEDASPDNALTICRQYADQYDNVQLFQHPNGENRGAGATRNLGIEMASCQWIAFLDADDYYLPDRFVKTQQVLEQHPSAEGIYEAVRNIFETQEHKEQFLAKRPPKFLTDEFRSVGYHVFEEAPPEQLFETLITGGSGFIHLDGLTIRKYLAEKVGGFHTGLKVMQDTHFHFKLALMGDLYNGGYGYFVAERLLHEENRITNTQKEDMNYFKYALFKDLFKWAIHWKVASKQIDHIIWQLGQCEIEMGFSILGKFKNKLSRKIENKF
jgi:glycosyltransferase involved in cell wall biosynthesis